MALQLQRHYRYLIRLSFLIAVLLSTSLQAGSDTNTTQSSSSGTSTSTPTGSSTGNQQQKKEKPHDFTKEAYTESTGMTYPALAAVRAADLVFNYRDPRCCCNNKIMALFARDTAKIMAKLNPATDMFIGSVRHILESNDLTKKKIKNLKIIVGLYSFKDLYIYNPPVQFEADVKKCKKLNGCEAVDLGTQEGQEKYLNVINCFENGGNYFGKPNPHSGAYGRYQFIPSTAAQYCAKAGGGCCATWKQSPACQDKMFLLFTQDNAASLANNHVPINTCTLYIAHQQGVAGLTWLMGGKYPKSFGVLKNRIHQNVGTKTWQQAEVAGLTNSEDGLRKVFASYWSKKFGGDIMAGLSGPGGPGSGFGSQGLANLTGELNDFYQRLENGRLFLREGILLDQYEENHHLENMDRALHLRNSVDVLVN